VRHRLSLIVAAVHHTLSFLGPKVDTCMLFAVCESHRQGPSEPLLQERSVLYSLNSLQCAEMQVAPYFTSQQHGQERAEVDSENDDEWIPPFLLPFIAEHVAAVESQEAKEDEATWTKVAAKRSAQPGAAPDLHCSHCEEHHHDHDHDRNLKLYPTVSCM
jgi:hypothetical protein